MVASGMNASTNTCGSLQVWEIGFDMEYSRVCHQKWMSIHFRICNLGLPLSRTTITHIYVYRLIDAYGVHSLILDLDYFFLLLLLETVV